MTIPDDERPDAIVEVSWEYERERPADRRAGDPSLVVGYWGRLVRFVPRACADSVRQAG